MKPYLSLLLIVLFFLPSLACGAITTRSIDGSGKLETQEIDVSNFDGVTLDGFGDVFIGQGDSESLTVQTDDNLMPLLDIKVIGRQLILGIKPNLNINPSRSITYNLTVKNLTAIALKGSGNFRVETVQSQNMAISLFGSGDINIKGLDTDSLSMDLSGSGNITIGNIAAKTIDTSVKGSGDIKLDGKSETQTVAISGSGNYLAGNLETTSADIRIPGSADATIWAKDTLKVSIQGSGNIRYYGKPTIDQSVLGSGNIISLGEK